MEYPAVVNLL